jgi:hypothetical protein
MGAPLAAAGAAAGAGAAVLFDTAGLPAECSAPAHPDSATPSTKAIITGEPRASTPVHLPAEFCDNAPYWSHHFLAYTPNCTARRKTVNPSMRRKSSAFRPWNSAGAISSPLWLLCTRGLDSACYGLRHHGRGNPAMKKLALVIIAVLAVASVAGCATPPPPVVTKG